MAKSGAKLFIEKVPKPVELKLSKEQREKRSEALWIWLDRHKRINVKGICDDAGCARAGIVRAYKKRQTLNQSTLLKMESVLAKYGL